MQVMYGGGDSAAAETIEGFEEMKAGYVRRASRKEFPAIKYLVYL
jgi:hypothetical protein